MAELTPRTNPRLIGHDAAEALLLQDFTAGKLAHGWIISGPRGIGKATLAYRFARSLLAGEHPADLRPGHPVWLRMAAGSHADLLVIEPLYNARKEEFARDITVTQAREIEKFLSLTPGEGQWRVVIIDPADALNANAANAILKILEEPPPQAILLLISHNPGRLLPTIRSRCRQLRLSPLNYEQFAAVMRHVEPDIGGSVLGALAQLSGLSPGDALELHAQQAIALYGQLLEPLQTLPEMDLLKVHAFADALTTGQVHTNWQIFTRLALTLFERITYVAGGMEIDPVSESEEEVLNRLSALHPAAVWAAKWQQVADQFLLAERLHLDYKQLIIIFFHSIAGREEWQIGAAA